MISELHNLELLQLTALKKCVLFAAEKTLKLGTIQKSFCTLSGQSFPK